jgi:phage shock protein A
MGLFDRMGRVISSNVNSLLDKSEDPKKLLELNLDEMGEQLKRGRQDVVAAVAEEKRLKKKVEELETEVEKWDKRAELALKTGDEGLAREALKQKKRVQSERDTAESARTGQRDVALKMKDELEQMERKLEELKLRKGTLAARAEQARSGGGSEALGARGGSNAFAEFRRMEGEIEGKEAQNSAMNEVEEALGKGQGRGPRGEVPRSRAASGWWWRRRLGRLGRRQGRRGRRGRARGVEEANSRVRRFEAHARGGRLRRRARASEEA